MHVRADASDPAPNWPDDIFATLQHFDVRQVPYVPDAGQLVTMRGEWGEFNPWQVPMGSTTQGVFELSGIKVLRASNAAEVPAVLEAAAGSLATVGL